MSNRSRRHSDKSNNSKLNESAKSNGHGHNAGLTEMEYFWSIELNAENRTHIWNNNEDMEEGDEDFIEYTLFIKSAALGENAVPNEHNLVMLESAGSDGDPQKGCIIHLCYGQNNMTQLDASVSGKVGPTTFTLAEGSGPIYICGSQLLEFPKDDSFADTSQTESEEEETEEETEEEDADMEEEKELEKPEVEVKKATKRKASLLAGKPKQKAKVNKEMADDDEEDEEEEEESEDESEEEVKFKKTKKGKENGKKETPKGKANKKPAKKSKK
ncbi:nucleoplasmin-like protein [Elysia marginata]|uniref:Nucleoplasmin-like protein n=1 Tax=Elysia marginata TaxID=1093978 RepID=A0AAV4G0U7_9GAST|nr:nucleoplasmin-like protein [Elysia marginata]